MDAGLACQIVSWLSNAGQGELTEDRSRCVVASKASFAHTRAGEIIVSPVFTFSPLSFSSDDPAIEARVSRRTEPRGAGKDF
jgi:hypothetical protein